MRIAIRHVSRQLNMCIPLLTQPYVRLRRILRTRAGVGKTKYICNFLLTQNEQNGPAGLRRAPMRLLVRTDRRWR
jgi:hypothetical protein